MRSFLPVYRASAVSPAPGTLAHMPNRDLSQKIIGHHHNNERELLSEAVIALFNRVVRPELTPQHNQTNPDFNALILLTHVMQVCVPQPQASGSTTPAQLSVKDFVRTLARNVIINRQPTDNFATVQSAFNLLENKTPEEIFHYNAAVKAENDRIDKVTSKIHLAGGIAVAALGAIQAVLTNVSGNKTPQEQDNNAYSGTQIASFTICALLAIIGGVHSSVESYQEGKKVQPHRPAASSTRPPRH